MRLWESSARFPSGVGRMKRVRNHLLVPSISLQDRGTVQVYNLLDDLFQKLKWDSTPSIVRETKTFSDIFRGACPNPHPQQDYRGVIKADRLSKRGQETKN